MTEQDKAVTVSVIQLGIGSLLLGLGAASISAGHAASAGLLVASGTWNVALGVIGALRAH